MVSGFQNMEGFQKTQSSRRAIDRDRITSRREVGREVGKEYDQRVQTTVATDPSGDEEQNQDTEIIERFYDEFYSTFNERGIQHLTRLKAMIEQRISEEHARLNVLENQLNYRGLLLEELCFSYRGHRQIRWHESNEGPISSGTKVDHPKVQSGEFDIEAWQYLPEQLHVRIQASDESLAEADIDADALPNRIISFPLLPRTYPQLETILRLRFAPWVRTMRRSINVVKLLRCRLHLLERLLWAYDVMGAFPDFSLLYDSSGWHDNNFLDRIGVGKNALKQAALTVRMLDAFRRNSEGHNPDSQAELIRYIEEHVPEKERWSNTGGAVIKGTKRLLNKAYRADTTGQTFFASLMGHEAEIMKLAEKHRLLGQVLTTSRHSGSNS
jgi:hypothetical protein